MPKIKVDLTLLKKLVGELETSLATVDSINTDTNPDVNELTVEASKAAGLAAGVMRESSSLILDIDDLVRGSQSPKPKSDLLDKLQGLLGKPGGSN